MCFFKFFLEVFHQIFLMTDVEIFKIYWSLSLIIAKSLKIATREMNRFLQIGYGKRGRDLTILGSDTYEISAQLLPIPSYVHFDNQSLISRRKWFFGRSQNFHRRWIIDDTLLMSKTSFSDHFCRPHRKHLIESTTIGPRYGWTFSNLG
jgi:hypothetical protein